MKKLIVGLITFSLFIFLISHIQAATYFKVTKDISRTFPVDKKIKVGWGKADWKGNMGTSHTFDTKNGKAILHFQTNWWKQYNISIGLELIVDNYGSYGTNWKDSSQNWSASDYCWEIEVLKKTTDWPKDDNSFSLSSC